LTALHPETDSSTDRFNLMILAIFGALFNKEISDYVKLLPILELANYNSHRLELAIRPFRLGKDAIRVLVYHACGLTYLLEHLKPLGIE
jgi:hypothetical protein